MTNEQIFIKLVTKLKAYHLDLGVSTEQAFKDIWINEPYRYYSFIFNHKVAKALWGEGKECYFCKGESKNWVKGTCPECFANIKYQVEWQYHLQQMVLEPEPLKYLEKFL